MANSYLKIVFSQKSGLNPPLIICYVVSLELKFTVPPSRFSTQGGSKASPSQFFQANEVARRTAKWAMAGVQGRGQASGNFSANWSDF